MIHDTRERRVRLPIVLERLCLLAALAFILISLVRPPGYHNDVPIGQPLSLAPGFAAGAVYSSTYAGALPAELPTYGSWTNGDAAMGSLATPWFATRPKIALYVAGYPNNPGLSLYAEVRDGHSVRQLVVSPTNPGEEWARVVLPLSAKRGSQFRIVATDRSTSVRGWLGFSLPCDPASAVLTAADELARIIGCAALCLSLVVLPGLALARRWPVFADGSFTFLPGLATLTLTGFLYWICPAGAHPRLLFTGLIVALLVALLWLGRKDVGNRQIDSATRYAMTVAFAIFAIAIGRSMYAPGPTGELFGGTVSRTFEPGDRSDSRISFHVAQLALLHAPAYGPMADDLFSTWSFSARGPIAGLATVPIVLSANARPPAAKPQQPWSPFDVEGFAAYRIAMFCFACTVFVSFFAVVRRAAGTQAAIFALSIAALAPFAVHETLFTWPKLFATSLICTAAALFVMNRYFVAGLTIGAAYLIHPSVLFSVVPFASAACIRGRSSRQIARTLGALLVGLVLVLGFWRIVNGEHYAQGRFLAFLLEAGDRPYGIGTWFESRFESLANTLLPFWLIIFDATNPRINQLHGLSSVFVHLGFSYWSTLPFGIGLLYFPTFVIRIAIGAKRSSRWFIGIVALPFLTFTIFWGSTSTGMMREGLQWWFFILIGFVAVTATRRFDASALAIAADRPWIVARALEVGLVTFGLTALDGGKLIDSDHRLTDILALGITVSATMLLSFTVWIALRRAAIKPATLPEPQAAPMFRQVLDRG